MNTEDTIRPTLTTLKPPEIEADDFKYGYNMARVASIEVLDSIPGGSTYSLRMGFLAYTALTTNEFPSMDHIKAAEYAEKIGLGAPKS